MSFHVDAGSNPYYFSVVVESEDGDGDLAGIDLREAASGAWISMKQSWGAHWKLNSGLPLEAPFSLRLTSGFGNTLVATNVIPSGWQPSTTFRSSVNFNA